MDARRLSLRSRDARRFLTAALLADAAAC